MHALRTTRAATLAAVIAGLVALPAWTNAGTAGAVMKSTHPATLVLSNTDGGHTFAVATGATIKAVLRGNSVDWSIPATSDKTVLQQTHGSSSTKGSARATFVALRAGSAQLTSEGRPVCRGTGPCPKYIILWQVTINVS
jgi:hypothetical protein